MTSHIYINLQQCADRLGLRDCSIELKIGRAIHSAVFYMQSNFQLASLSRYCVRGSKCLEKLTAVRQSRLPFNN